MTISYEKIDKKLELDFSKLDASIFVDCAASRHGMEQKYGDAKSGDKLGLDKYNHCLKLYTSHQAKAWNLTGAGEDDSELWTEAFTLLGGTGKALEAAVAKATGWTSEQMAEAFTKRPDVKAAYEAAKANRLTRRKQEAVKAAVTEGFKPV